MRNINKILFIGAAAVAAFASCTRDLDYSTTIDVAQTLVYAENGGIQKMETTKIAHTPVGSFGGYQTVFRVKCNSGNHEAQKVTVEYSEAAAKEYLATADIKASVLPAEFIRVCKYSKDDESLEPAKTAVLTLPADEFNTADSVKVALVGDFTLLQEREYIAAVTVKGDKSEGSQVMGTYYLKVLTEQNCIKPIESVSDIAGFQPSDYTGMEYIQGLSGSITSRVNLPSNPVEVIVDLKDKYLLTGIKLGLYSSWSIPSFSSIECSEDSQTWQQAGTPEELFMNGNDGYIGFYGYLSARYVKFTVDASAVSSYYRKLNSFSFFFIESTEPMVYLAQTEFTDEVRHTPAGSESTMKIELDVLNALAKNTSISVTGTQKNDLVAAYNTAHGTNYQTVNQANVKIEGTAVIAANETQAKSPITVSLQGDLSGFTSKDGYLIPVELTTSDAGVSAKKGTAYIIVRQRTVYFRSYFDVDALGLKRVSDKSGWSVQSSGSNYGSWGYGQDWPGMIDNDYENYVYSMNANVQINFTLDKEYDIEGFSIAVAKSYYGETTVNDYTVLVSSDGSEYEELGTVSMNDGSIVMKDTVGHCAMYGPKKAQYVRIVYSASYVQLCEFDIYTK